MREKPLFLIVVGVFFMIVASNHYILNNSRFIHTYDESSYVKASIEFYQKFVNKQHHEIFRRIFLEGGCRKFFPLAAGSMMVLLDKAGIKDINLMTIFTNAAFLFILLISTYKIGSMLYNKTIGAAAAVLLAFSPYIFVHSRINMIDLPLAAMACASFWSLLKTDHFFSLGFSILTGILFAASKFTRETAVIFIIPPVLYYFLRSLNINEGPLRRKIAINFIITIASFVFLIGISSFGIDNRKIINEYNGYILKAFMAKNDFSIYRYTKNFLEGFLGAPVLITALPLIVRYLINIKKRNLFLTIWLFVPLLFFPLFPTNSARYLMPAAPALFLILASEAFAWFRNSKKIAHLYITVLALTMVFQYAVFSFFPKTYAYRPYIDWGGNLFSITQESGFYDSRKIVDLFRQENAHGDKINKVIFTFHSGVDCDVDVRFKFQDMPFYVEYAPYADKRALAGFLSSGDYIVDKTYDATWDRDVRMRYLSEEFKKYLAAGNIFKKLGEFKSGDNEKICVYKRIGHI